MSGKVIFVTDASGGIGAVAARALADAGHIVYAGLGRRSWSAATMGAHTQRRELKLRPIEAQLQDQRSVDRTVREVLEEAGQIDAVVHSAHSYAYGPAESFTSYQLSQAFDIDVLASQRVNRAVLPEMRRRRSGCLIWINQPPPHTPSPRTGAYAAASAAVEQLARTYAIELEPFGIKTCLVDSPLLHATFGEPTIPDDAETVSDYEDVLPHGNPKAAESGMSAAAAGTGVEGELIAIAESL